MLEPGVTGAWSVKDILAHVTTWEGEALKHLPLVLRGEKPGDIPVEQAQTLELAVNPAAAEAMGVTLPEALVARADIVVR